MSLYLCASVYILRTMLEMLVRRGRRDVVGAQWRRFTCCQQHEFVPDRPEDVFAWRTKHGTNASGFPKQSQSWAELVIESFDRTNGCSPLGRSEVCPLKHSILKGFSSRGKVIARVHRTFVVH